MARDELQPLDNKLLLVCLRQAIPGHGQGRGGQRRLPGMAVEEHAGAAGVAGAVAVQAGDGLRARGKDARGGRRPIGEDRHRLGGEVLVFPAPELEKVAVEDDVGVEDLPGARVHPARAHREAGPGGDPAEGVVIHILRIPVGLVGLLADFDGAGEAGLLEGFVPGLDPLTDRLPVAERDRLLDPKHDRLLRRRDRGRGISLLEVPAVDVADEAVLVDILREVLEGGDEVADPVVGEARPVAGLRQHADGIVDVDGDAAAVGDSVEFGLATRAVGGGDFELRIVREVLHPRPRGAIAGEGEAGERAADLGEIGHEDRRQVDDRRAVGGIGGDRHTEQHAVGVGQIDCLLLGAPLVGEEADIAADDVDVVVDFAKLPDPVVTESPAHAAEELAVADPLGDRDQHEQLPAEDRVGQFRPYFVVLAMERDQPGDARRILDHGGKRRLSPFCLGGRRRLRGCGGGCRGVGLDSVGGRNRGRLIGTGRGDFGGSDGQQQGTDGSESCQRGEEHKRAAGTAGHESGSPRLGRKSRGGGTGRG